MRASASHYNIGLKKKNEKKKKKEEEEKKEEQDESFFWRVLPLKMYGDTIVLASSQNGVVIDSFDF
jgi:hypothetical protein